MYPSLPFRVYGYGDFIQFNLGSFNNIPNEQTPYILAGVANDAVNKANSNQARMYVYNKLCVNNWYNDDFVNISRTILAIISGRLQAGVDITHIANDIIDRYLTCYTSVQVLIVPALKSQLAPNLVLAAQHNASQYQQFNEEANKVFMNQNNQRAGMMPGMQMPMQQGMQMQPVMQPGMVPMQPGMQMMPMQPGMQMQPGMMPMPQGMQPMMPMQPGMVPNQQGFTYQSGYQNHQQPTVSDKYKDVPEAYKAKEDNVFTKAAENIPSLQTAKVAEEVKPEVVYLTKDSPQNFIKVGDKVISFDNVLQTKYSSDFKDKRFFGANVGIIGCFKDAIETTRKSQIDNQDEKYIYQAYSAPYQIVDEYMTLFSCSDVINEVLLATTGYEGFAGNLGAFYLVIQEQMESLDKVNNDRQLIELYEKYKFVRSIEKRLVTKVNNQLSKVYGLSVTIENFHSDAIDLIPYLNKKQGNDLAFRFTRYMNDLVSVLRDSYRENLRSMANQFMSSGDDTETISNDFEYQIRNIYVINIPISKDNYQSLKVAELKLNEPECPEVAQWLKTALKHADVTLSEYDLFAITLDDDVFQIHYNPNEKVFSLKKVEVN